MSARKTRRRGARMLALAALLLAPPLGLVVWHWPAGTAQPIRSASVIADQYGYAPTMPPSGLFGPGTFVTVETLEDGALKLHLACEMEKETLAAMWKRSQTVDSSVVSKVKDAFKGTAGVLVSASRVDGAGETDVDVILRDIHIITMAQEGLIAVRNAYLKGPCEQAVLWNLRAGAMVCQTEESLQTDIVHNRRTQQGFNAGVEADFTEEISGAASFDRKGLSLRETHGDDLIVGIRVRESNCFLLDDAGGQLAESWLRGVAGVDWRGLTDRRTTITGRNGGYDDGRCDQIGCI